MSNGFIELDIEHRSPDLDFEDYTVIDEFEEFSKLLSNQLFEWKKQARQYNEWHFSVDLPRKNSFNKLNLELSLQKTDDLWTHLKFYGDNVSDFMKWFGVSRYACIHNASEHKSEMILNALTIALNEAELAVPSFVEFDDRVKGHEFEADISAIKEYFTINSISSSIFSRFLIHQQATAYNNKQPEEICQGVLQLFQNFAYISTCLDSSTALWVSYRESYYLENFELLRTNFWGDSQTYKFDPIKRIQVCCSWKPFRYRDLSIAHSVSHLDNDDMFKDAIDDFEFSSQMSELASKSEGPINVSKREFTVNNIESDFSNACIINETESKLMPQLHFLSPSNKTIENHCSNLDSKESCMTTSSDINQLKSSFSQVKSTQDISQQEVHSIVSSDTNNYKKNTKVDISEKSDLMINTSKESKLKNSDSRTDYEGDSAHSSTFQRYFNELSPIYSVNYTIRDDIDVEQLILSKTTQYLIYKYIQIDHDFKIMTNKDTLLKNNLKIESNNDTFRDFSFYAHKSLQEYFKSSEPRIQDYVKFIFKEANNSDLIHQNMIIIFRLIHVISQLSKESEIQLVWSSIVSHLRHFWEDLKLITPLKQPFGSKENPSPRDCMLLQQLKTLNCCIQRKRDSQYVPIFPPLNSSTALLGINSVTSKYKNAQPLINLIKLYMKVQNPSHFTASSLFKWFQRNHIDLESLTIVSVARKFQSAEESRTLALNRFEIKVTPKFVTKCYEKFKDSEDEDQNETLYAEMALHWLEHLKPSELLAELYHSYIVCIMRQHDTQYARKFPALDVAQTNFITSLMSFGPKLHSIETIAGKFQSSIKDESVCDINEAANIIQQAFENYELMWLTVASLVQKFQNNNLITNNIIEDDYVLHIENEKKICLDLLERDKMQPISRECLFLTQTLKSTHRGYACFNQNRFKIASVLQSKL